MTDEKLNSTNLARIFMDGGLYDQAISEATKCIQTNPKDAEAFYIRGKSYYNKHQRVFVELALPDLTTAIKLNPKFAPAYTTRASILVTDRLYDEALSDANKAIKLDPLLTDAYLTRSYIYGAVKRQWELAIQDINKVIEHEPRNITAYSWRSGYYEAIKQYEKAIADINKTDELDTKNPDNYAMDYWRLGKCYLAIDDYDAASSNFLKSTEFGYLMAWPDAYLGYTYFKKGESILALTNFNKAIEMEPKYDQTYSFRADYFISENDSASAIADLKKVLSLSKDNNLIKSAKERLKSLEH